MPDVFLISRHRITLARMRTRAMLVIPLYFQYGSWYLIRPHISTFNKLGSCNCSSWKLLAAINMTRPECSVVAPGHTLAYAAVRYLSRVRNLDRLSPKTQLFKFSRSNRQSSRKTQNLLRVGRLAFCHLLRDKLRWEKGRLIFIHFLYKCISRKIYFQAFSRDLLPCNENST